ncbi:MULTISPECIES: VOC family protein [Rhizobium/Agrobacterium group]|uniref:VOC family protein n=1 Tax=Rhizobium/Agrobacterium group TaxID=227290 RepID=UPI0006B904AF|nr:MULTISPECIES: VOC family protein [Rhizobium/Agrobacterium group]KPF61098.1 glyoxalase [Rhizobium sp. AAP116]QGG91983.1 VOC family protein [Agrobacterium sp. MA01]
MTEAPTRPDDGIVEKAITFFYYVDLPRALDFYTEVMGFPLEIDQGWSKILRIAEHAYVGLVDETRGMHRANPIKPVQLCIRVPDVDAWHRFLSSQNAIGLTEPKDSVSLGIRAFVLEDPEGYQIEVQSVLR